MAEESQRQGLAAAENVIAILCTVLAAPLAGALVWTSAESPGSEEMLVAMLVVLIAAFLLSRSTVKLVQRWQRSGRTWGTVEWCVLAALLAILIWWLSGQLQV